MKSDSKILFYSLPFGFLFRTLLFVAFDITSVSIFSFFVVFGFNISTVSCGRNKSETYTKAAPIRNPISDGTTAYAPYSSLASIAGANKDLFQFI